MQSKIEKTCRSCGASKLITDFSKDKATADGFSSTCSSCRKKQSQIYYEVNREKKRSYNSQYYRKNKTKIQEKQAVYENSPKGKWVNFYSHKVRGKHELLISEEEFYQWLDKQNSYCHYCGMTNGETLLVLKYFKIRKSPKRLEYDRKNNKVGYSADNMVLACTICNFHKGSFFQYKEFRDIAQRFLAPKFNKILKKFSSD